MFQPSVRGLKQIIAWETFCISHNARHVWMGTPQPSTWSQLMVRPYHCQPTEPAEVQPQKSNANHKNLKKEHQKYYGQNEITSKPQGKTRSDNLDGKPAESTAPGTFALCDKFSNCAVVEPHISANLCKTGIPIAQRSSSGSKGLLCFWLHLISHWSVDGKTNRAACRRALQIIYIYI